MVAFEFNPLYHSAVVFLSAAIPGLAIGLPLLKETKLSFAEKFLLSFFLGLFAGPTLLFLGGLAGLKFSLFTSIAGMFVLTAAGILWGMKNGAFEIRLPQLDAGRALQEPLEFGKKAAPGALLLLAVFLSFWIRIQTYSPIYSELDPYFYVYGTSQIIREGMVPLKDDTAWWPEVMGTHRTSPLKMYLEAQWYSLYTKGGEYSNYLLFAIASWLPPIAAGMLAFGAYLLVSSVYGRRYGIFAAFLMAFLPSTIFKMSAGVNEAAPVGMMMLFMAMGLLAQSLLRRDAALKLLTAAAFFVTVAASNFQSVAALPLAGILLLQSAENFVLGRRDSHLLEAGAYAVAGLFLGTLFAYGAYSGAGLSAIFSGIMLMPVLSLGLTAAVHYALGRYKPDEKRRWTALAACAVLGLAALATPLGEAAKKQVKDYVGAVDFNTALQRTIAEQNRAGSSFEGEAGFLALVPQNHPESGIGGAVYFVLGNLASFFTWLSGIFFSVLDAVFRLAAGIRDTTDAKDPSLLFAFMAVAVVGLAYGHFSRKGEAREVPSVFLLILLLTIPIVYVGINKIKFTVYLGMMAVVLASAAFAETEKLLRWIAGKIQSAEAGKYAAWAFSGLLLLTVWAQAAGPAGYGMIILSKSLEPRYQDDPAGMAPKMASLCEALRARGVDYSQIKGICDAGAGPQYADTINKQFDFSLCWLSQTSISELFPGDSAADKQRSSDAVTAARFRCNRLGDYWVDAMEWIKNNLGADDRLNSWWDYGHWTNYFGEKKTVLRNEHASEGMIGRVAHDFIIGSTQDLTDSMNYFDSRYVLFDVELIGGGSFGGKYGALNYLGCVHEGNTTLNDQPGTSDCEFEHSPERIVIPTVQVRENSCAISESQQLAGVFAYRLGRSGADTSRPAYCVGETTLRSGEKVTATYYLDRRDENGDLVLSKGLIRTLEEGKDYAIAELVYDNRQIWPGQNGTWVGGMEDAKTGFYRSNLYKGFYLEDLPGFELAYRSPGGQVKIYRMKGFVGNREGKVDSLEAARKN